MLRKVDKLQNRVEHVALFYVAINKKNILLYFWVVSSFNSMKLTELNPTRPCVKLKAFCTFSMDLVDILQILSFLVS